VQDLFAVSNDATALVAWAHGQAFRAVSAKLGCELEGLSVASRWARKSKLISQRTGRRLEKLDAALHVTRHISQPKVQYFVQRLFAELEATSLPCRTSAGWPVQATKAPIKGSSFWEDPSRDSPQELCTEEPLRVDRDTPSSSADSTESGGSRTASDADAQQLSAVSEPESECSPNHVKIPQVIPIREVCSAVATQTDCCEAAETAKVQETARVMKTDSEVAQLAEQVKRLRLDFERVNQEVAHLRQCYDSQSRRTSGHGGADASAVATLAKAAAAESAQCEAGCKVAQSGDMQDDQRQMQAPTIAEQQRTVEVELVGTLVDVLAPIATKAQKTVEVPQVDIVVQEIEVPVTKRSLEPKVQIVERQADVPQVPTSASMVQTVSMAHEKTQVPQVEIVGELAEVPVQRHALCRSLLVRVRRRTGRRDLRRRSAASDVAMLVQRDRRLTEPAVRVGEAPRGSQAGAEAAAQALSEKRFQQADAALAAAESEASIGIVEVRPVQSAGAAPCPCTSSVAAVPGAAPAAAHAIDVVFDPTELEGEVEDDLVNEEEDDLDDEEVDDLVLDDEEEADLDEEEEDEQLWLRRRQHMQQLQAVACGCSDFWACNQRMAPLEARMTPSEVRMTCGVAP